MFDSVMSTYRKYATFYGRETRRTYLEFFFFHVIQAALVIAILIFLVAYGWITLEDNSAQSLEGSEVMTLSVFGILGFGALALFGLVQLASVVPWLALQARRLHDVNLSAWMLLLYFVPFGQMALFILCCLNSVNGLSRYEDEGRPATQKGSFKSFEQPGNQW
jgi:uncharacterized membrane protein YhaH (DUF805 family)